VAKPSETTPKPPGFTLRATPRSLVAIHPRASARGILAKASEKTFVIGDIHGCLEMLNRLMDKIAWHPPNDQIIFLGDYVGRGENPKGVVDYILALRRCCSNVECLIGNHEVMFLDYLRGKNEDVFISNGGWTTLKSYLAGETEELTPIVSDDHMAFYSSLKPYIELEDYYIVHAGFRPGVDISEQTLEDMIRIREPFIQSNYDFGKKVIFGHTPFSQPLVMENKI
jgi:serine/threonine protein phosphatase 1